MTQTLLWDVSILVDRLRHGSEWRAPGKSCSIYCTYQVLLQIRAPATLLVRPADLDVSVTDDKLEMSRIAQHLQDGFWYVAVTGPPVLVAYH